MEKELLSWSKQISSVHLPRWEELPDMDLYKDQVVTLVEKYLGTLLSGGDKFITPSMINNYVKWKMIPAPSKKKQYNREHLAYLISISALKQVINIKDIKSGIEYQAGFEGTRNAYNTFCELLEQSIVQMVSTINPTVKYTKAPRMLETEEVAMRMVCIAFASRTIAIKKVALQNELLELGKK